MGTGLHGTSGTPTFTMSAYTTDDTEQPIAASVAALDAEVGSVRTVWPTTPIVLVGHSYGGLVAEEWWEQRGRRATIRASHTYSRSTPRSTGSFNAA
ncbi:MAG: alpha/beta fold hydrolase [Solirubrobacteraceae bacterium]